MAIGGVGADDDNHIGRLDAVEILGAGRCAEGGFQAIAGRRMANPRTGIDIVVAKCRAHQLLHEERLLVGAARRGDPANRALAIVRLDALEFRRRMGNRHLPADFLPGLVDRAADHRRHNAFAMIGIAPGKTPLDAAMAMIGLAVLVRHHAHQFLPAHFGAEGAADPAIGAGGDDGAVGRADLDDLFLGQGRGRTRRDTGAARYAFAVEEHLALRRRNPAVKAAPGNRQRKGALNFITGAHAARTGDAFRCIEGKIRVRIILGEFEMVLAGITIAHIAQAHRAGHILQFAITIGRAGQAIERMVGDIQLHHALAQLLQPFGLGVDDHAGGNRRRARSRCPGAAIDLDKAQPARPEGIERIGGAQPRDGRAQRCRRSHHRSSGRHGDGFAIDDQRNRSLCRGRRGLGAKIGGSRICHFLACHLSRRIGAEIFGKMRQRAHHRIGRKTT